MAIGARPAQLMRMVYRQSLLTLAAGLVLGFGGVYLVIRVLPNVLYGVHTMDALSLAASIAVLAAAVVLALTIPARRATKVDPILMLRQD